jgi:peptidyl-prolyl cis-trans isomerase SurA
VKNSLFGEFVNNKIIVLSALMLLSIGTAQNAMAEQLVDRIVAVVNGQPILHSEVQAKAANNLVSVSFHPAKESSSAYEKSLQDEINFMLILAKSEELKINVSDSEVEREIDAMLSRRSQNRDMLMAALRQSGIEYEDYKLDFRDQLILRQFQGAVIRPRVKMTDRDVQTYFSKKTGSQDKDSSLNIRQIFFQVPSGSAVEIVEAKMALARSVHQKLAAGMNFVEAVKLYSDAPGARENGGLMEGVRASQLSKEMRRGLKGLKEKSYSFPIKSAAGIHLLFLESKVLADNEEFERSKKQLENELFMLEAAKQTQKWLTEYRQKSDVRILR